MRGILLAIIFTLSVTAKAQQWEWVKEINGQAQLIEQDFDAGGNMVLAGIPLNGPIEFGDGITVSGVDPFIIKATETGTFYRKIEVAGLRTMGVNANGRIFIAGTFSGSFSLLGQTVSSTGAGIYVAALDSAMNLVWLKKIDSGAEASASELEVRQDGGFYLVGSYNGTFSNGTTSLPATQEMTMFVTGYSAAGTPDLALGANGESWGRELEVDNGGDIFLVVDFNDTVTFAGNTIDQNPGMGYHFVTRISPSGSAEWMQFMGSNYYEPHKNLCLGENGGFYMSYWHRYDGFSVYELDNTGNQIHEDHYNALYSTCYQLKNSNGKRLMSGYQAINMEEQGSFFWSLGTGGFDLPSEGSASAAYGALHKDNNYYIFGVINDTASFSGIQINGSGQRLFLGKYNSQPGVPTLVAAQTSENYCTVSPNPSAGLFTISTSIEKATVKVFDLKGTCVMEKKVNNNQFTIDMSGQPKGVYLLLLENGMVREEKKIVVE